MEKELTIIIPTHNRKELLLRTLEAINRQTYDLSKIEVLVIDDYSGEDISFSLKTVNPKYKLKFLRLKENIGQGMVRNRGIKLAKGKYILFIGDDTIPDERLIEEHMKIHKENSGIAVLGKVLWADEIRSDFMNYIEKIQFHYNTIKDKNNVKLHFYTSNISLEKYWFEEEEYSDEFGNYGFEDLELGYRLEKKGLRVVYNPLATVYHYHTYTFEQFCERMFKVGKSAVVFAKLHPELKTKYIPRFINAFKLCSFLISRQKLLGKRAYWYSNFVYYYIKGIEENVEKSKSIDRIFNL